MFWPAVVEAGAGHAGEVVAAGRAQEEVAVERRPRSVRLPCRAAREPQHDPRPAVVRQLGLALARAEQRNQGSVRVPRGPEFLRVELGQVSQPVPGPLPVR
jgi:hypothetical protein